MTVRRISLDNITPDPGQPRKAFDPGELDDLAAAIKANGLIQPITVRAVGRGQYVIIAGERRWRAHVLLRGRQGGERFAKIACIVVTSAQHTVDIRCTQIVENIQRADMHILEEADAFVELVALNMTEAEIAERLGLAPFRVRWRLQLRNLAPDVRKLVAGGQLDRQQSLEVARLDRHDDQRRIVRMINRGELIGWKAVRNAVDAINGQVTPIDLFGPDAAPIATAKEVAVVGKMETRIESVVRALNGGWHKGECIVAAKVSPDRAGRMADQLSTLRATITTMERELRNVAAQAKIALAG